MIPKLFNETRDGLCDRLNYFDVVEFNNGTSVVAGRRSFFFAHDPAIEFLRMNAGMIERSPRRTRNFLRRTVRSAGRRANL